MYTKKVQKKSVFFREINEKGAEAPLLTTSKLLSNRLKFKTSFLVRGQVLPTHLQ